MKKELIAFAQELNQKLAGGMNLRELSQYTYTRRESGDNIPYMSIGDQVGKTVTGIYASPTTKQKELKAFFSETRIGGNLPRYTLRVSLENGVEFFEVLEKGGERINLI